MARDDSGAAGLLPPPAHAGSEADDAGTPGAPPAVAFGFAGWHGHLAAPHAPEHPAGLRTAVEGVIDPGRAAETLHWGRNYLYLAHLPTPSGALPLAVKQFRNEGWRRSLRRRLSGSKAAKSWRVARALLDAGILTPEPVLLAESDRPDGPSYYACRHLGDALEARYLLRAANAGSVEETFPEADLDAFLVALGRTVRRLHDAGFWHRDLSSGNVLIRWRDDAPPELHLLDLNRTRRRRRLTTSQRTRDLSRMMIHRPEHQHRFLEAYWSAPAAGGGATEQRSGRSGEAAIVKAVRTVEEEDIADPEPVGAVRHGLYRLYHHGFRFKNEAKKAVRRRLRGVIQAAKDLVLPRGAHAHIPRAPEGASTRDRAVWDPLSDQPHLHAGKMEKLLSRLRDAPAYLRQLRAAAAATPAAWSRYRELEAERWRQPVPFGAAGVALRPHPADPEGLLAAVDDLGTRHALLRLHPWADHHGDEEALARELAGRGLDLAFALPQNRELVRDPARWRAAVEELAERFSPFGGTFVVGQAPNRSKWGVWHPGELRDLASAAAEILRRRGAEVLGPGVIDFEPHATVGLVNYPGMPRFDALASLLYVDRRGAPEERQMGFDALDKSTLLQAVADTAEHCAGRSWITEVNWPLREGPHAPAGRLVAVDEATQADYLVRYLVPVLASGHTERAYWWQLVARGYGLLCPEEGDGGPALRRRPAFHALRTLLTELAGSESLGPLPGPPEEVRAYRFRRPDGATTVVAWAVGGAKLKIALPGELERAVDRDGRPAEATGRPLLGASPVYFRLAG